MTSRRTPRRAVLRAGAMLQLAGAVAALVVGPAAAASASLGSVPDQVAAYVADGSMVARLDDVYGKNAAGAGIDFDETTKPGPISRVYEWTDARLAGATTDHPVQLTNNWVVPVTVAEKPVGLATIWINPATVEPELADFVATPALATALAEVPPAAALVRDTASRSWLALADGTVTPLVAGTSGLTTPVPVASVNVGSGAAPTAAAASSPALGLAIGAVGIVVVVIVVVLLLPRRRRKSAPVGTVGEPEIVAEPEAVEAEVAEPEVVEPVLPTKPAPKPRSTSATKPSTPVTKPAASKPGGRSPASAAASTKPRTQKPPVQKPPTRKPPTRKPPAPKPPDPELPDA